MEQASRLLWRNHVRDLYLEKVQAFTTNKSFGKSITSWDYIILALWTEKKIMRRNELRNILGGVRH